MELRDELTTALGRKASATRTQAVLLSLVLAAMAVAVAGPIAFIALMSPHAARMPTQTSGPHLIGSALTGALLLVLADLAVQQIPILHGLPAVGLPRGFGVIFVSSLLLNSIRKGQSGPQWPLNWPLLDSVSATVPTRYCPTATSRYPRAASPRLLDQTVVANLPW